MKVMSVLAVVLFLSAATGLVHQLVEHNHWNELRDGIHKSPQKQKAIPPLVIDTFQSPTHNDLGFWHGSGENLTVEHSPGFVRFTPTDPDQNFHTQFDTHGCFSLWPWQNQFLHVVFEGTDKFSVSLNEHNAECNPRRRPFPGVPDTVEAARYVMRTIVSGDGEPSQSRNSTTQRGKSHSPAWNKSRKNDGHTRVPGPYSKTELYIPLSHFHIEQNRVMSVSFHGFYTQEPITLHRVEIVPMVPSPSPENEYFRIPSKLPSGRLVFRCSRPGSFAFGIDDGQPQLAQEVMQILDREDVRVTFFVVGAGLRDPETNFTQVYREMLQKGHQIALHSNTHPKMEALPTVGEIDDEILQTMQIFKERLDVESSYFRPPYGTVGARMRQQLAQHLPNPYIVNWSVDVEDWLWANTTTPEKQLEAFTNSVSRGGNLAVMHYLNPTTVQYLPQFIRLVKNAGLQIMRVDQCLGDGPPL
ncbi:Glycoside hydrolase/deacetylase beta/alpha-barrel [Penicillium lagena]|uniref:Glycoside hydrolase/deacetylase beta/alpha-barrel n=1 Tax=Penicillium lagena TaxID=94218 RepID=UPI0025408928|nr:Glycoside hydrolase/deacetylase beta/alpha-barrel [Penicillium lagena]KAJ5624382.1 Glycoside hydrolase/deacetylase beta/alpha-barrel [Penicillium lagena]